MARLIFKCPYLKAGTSARRGNYVRYIATRDGVDLSAKRENYVGYIAKRPRSHGLFTSDGAPIALSRVADEAAAHPGNLWTPILSLRREDAERLGYDSAERWRGLLRSYAPELAAAMKIPAGHFKWYAAFHDDERHPHAHMVVWSTGPSEGFLTKEGIRQIKAGLSARIFKDDLLHVYERQTKHRAQLGEQSRRRMAELIAAMQTGELHNDEIERLIARLSERLRKLKGKKQYGYLPASDKALVDAITDELCKDGRVAECYELWCDARADVLRTYQKDPPPPGALSKQPELKRIRNIVIEEASKLGGIESGGEELDVTENDAPEVSAPDGGDEERQKPTQTAETREPQPSADKDWRSAFNARAASAATRLLHHLGKIFADSPPVPKQGPRTERKLLRKLRQKKIAQGHAADDYVPRQEL